MGQYHTIELELNRAFVISKASWDTIYLDRLNMACDPIQTAELVALVAQSGKVVESKCLC